MQAFRSFVAVFGLGLLGCTFTPASDDPGGDGPAADARAGQPTIDAGEVLSGDPDAALVAPADASAADATPVSPPDECTGFAPLPGGQSGHLYRPIDAHTWPVAAATCTGLGGYLAIPDDRNEVRALVAAVTPVNAEYLWVGLSRDLLAQVPGSWITVEGDAPAYLPWYGGGRGVQRQPSSGDCVALDDRAQPLGGESWLFTGGCASNVLVSVCECAPDE